MRVHQFASLRSDEARSALKALDADIGIMAFVLQFAPQDFVGIPRHGTIQYHPSLLPKYRGPSSINWPIIHGDTETGLTIFRPTDGLDEGPVILQKVTPIGPDDTLASVYFDRLFPMGVQAMLEAADLVVGGTASRIPAGRITRDLRRLVPQGRGAHQLGQPRRHRLQPDSRLQSRPRRLDHAGRLGAADLRRAQDPGAHVPRRPGKDRGGGRGDRDVVSGHGAGRPHRGAAREARRWQEVGRHRSHHLRRDSIRETRSSARRCFRPQRMRRASSRNSSVSPWPRSWKRTVSVVVTTAPA